MKSEMDAILGLERRGMTPGQYYDTLSHSNTVPLDINPDLRPSDVRRIRIEAGDGAMATIWDATTNNRVLVFLVPPENER
jgi:hypothetical protein